MLGVIGRNGAGKSTLLKVPTRITTPTHGRAQIRGRVGSLLEVGTGFHPELTGRENVYLNGSVLGMKRREIARKMDAIVEFSGVEQFMDTPVKRYSSGMYVRLAFAVAAHLEPEILLVDEVLSVGDAEFQRRSLGRMQDFGASGRTVLFVSHNMQTVSRLCERAILLDGGRIVYEGSGPDVVAHYLHSGHGSGPCRSGGTSRPRPATGSCACAPCAWFKMGETRETVDVRYPVGIEIGFRVLRSRRPVFPKLKLMNGEGTPLQRPRHGPALARAGPARRLRLDGLDAGQPVERRLHDRRGRCLLALRREAASTRQQIRRGLFSCPRPRWGGLRARRLHGESARRDTSAARVDDGRAVVSNRP